MATMHRIEDVAKKLNVSSVTVRRMIDDGEITAVKVRGQWRISEDALQDYLRKNTNQQRQSER